VTEKKLKEVRLQKYIVICIRRLRIVCAVLQYR